MTDFIVGNVSNARVCVTKPCAKITPKLPGAMGILQCHRCGGKLVNNKHQAAECKIMQNPGYCETSYAFTRGLNISTHFYWQILNQNILWSNFQTYCTRSTWDFQLMLTSMLQQNKTMHCNGIEKMAKVLH